MSEMVQKVDEASVAAWCTAYIAKALNINASQISVDDELDSFGLDSAVLTSMLIEMEEWLGVDIPPSVLFSQTTLGGIASEVASRAA